MQTHNDTDNTIAPNENKLLKRLDLVVSFARTAMAVTLSVAIVGMASIAAGTIYVADKQFRKTIPNLTHTGRAANLGGYEASASYYEFNPNLRKAIYSGLQLECFMKSKSAFEKAVNTASEASPQTEARRLAFYKKAVELSSQIANPYIKASAIQGFVNFAVKYDYDKAAIPVSSPEYVLEKWRQPALQTAQTAKGVCVDYASIKMLMLAMSGFNQQDIYTLGLNPTPENPNQKDGHEVCLVKVGNRMLVLDNDTPSQKEARDFPSNALLNDDFSYFFDNYGRLYRPDAAFGFDKSIVYKPSQDKLWQTPPIDNSAVIDSKLEQDVKLRDDIFKLGRVLFQHNQTIKAGKEAQLPAPSKILGEPTRVDQKHCAAKPETKPS